MLERSPYPLLTLKLIGYICPCFEKAEDGPARKAAWALSNSIPIRWHRRLPCRDAGGGGSGAVGGFFSSIKLFGGGADENSILGKKGDDRYCYEPLENATLSVADAPSGPQLVVSPPPSPSFRSSSFTATDNDTASAATPSTSIRKKCIPLTAIKKVQIYPPKKGVGGNFLSSSTGGGGGRSRCGIEVLDDTGRTLLRLDVLKSKSNLVLDDNINDDEEEKDEESWGGNENDQVEDADESTRDTIIDHLHTLIEWERRRRAYIVMLGEEENDDAAVKNDDEDEMYVDEYDDGMTPVSPRTAAKKKGVIAEQGESATIK